MSRYAIIVCIVPVILGLGFAEDVPPRMEQFKMVDGMDVMGQFIELGSNDAIYARFSAISDSGIEVERVRVGGTVWRVFCRPLGEAHSIYMQKVRIKVNGKFLIIRSEASGGMFTEKRNIEDGKLVTRKARTRKSTSAP